MEPLHGSNSPSPLKETETSSREKEIHRAAQEQIKKANQEVSAFSWFDRAVVWLKESWIGKWILACFGVVEEKEIIISTPKLKELTENPPPQSNSSDDVDEKPLTPKDNTPPAPPSNPNSPIEIKPENGLSPSSNPLPAPPSNPNSPKEIKTENGLSPLSNPLPAPIPIKEAAPPAKYVHRVSEGDVIYDSEILEPFDTNKPHYQFDLVAVKTRNGFIAGTLAQQGNIYTLDRVLVRTGKIVKIVDIKDIFNTSAIYKIHVGDSVLPEQLDPITLVTFAQPGFLVSHNNKVVKVIEHKKSDIYKIFDGEKEFEVPILSIKLIVKF